MVKSVCMRAQPFSHAMRITVRYKVVHSSLVCLRPFSRQNSMVIIVSHFTISHVMQNTVKYKSIALFPKYSYTPASSFSLSIGFQGLIGKQVNKLLVRLYQHIRVGFCSLFTLLSIYELGLV